MEKTKFIDVDRTVLDPSPQRVRNILTLEERVRAIQAYNCRPMYTKVAKMFNCSWEQIKNIIANRDAIIEFYEATKNTERQVDPGQDEIRQRKITFLGECMYEYIQRLQFHTKADLTQELILLKAFEFRDLIQIDHFTPNKTWINHFKATYNFSLSNRQITLTRTPPSSMDLKDIMTYCTTNKAKLDTPSIVATQTIPTRILYRTNTQIAISNANDATLEEFIQRRLRKINFMEKALYEYIQRSQYHHKIVKLDETTLRKVATTFKGILKIENFTPNKMWFTKFQKRFDIDLERNVTVVKGTPPLSLDLKDILSYCKRNENKNPTIGHIRLKPKPSQLPMVSVNMTSPIAPVQQSQSTQGINFRILNHTLNKSPEHKPKVLNTSVKEEIIDLDDDEDIKPNISQLLTGAETDADCQPPPLKIQKIESIGDAVEQPVHSPGHWSEHSDEDDEELPKHVTNYTDALKLLKPLEEFAMLEENYRVIGLISQLEDIFKSQPKKK